MSKIFINHKDYQRIAKAIAFMKAHYLEQPDLNTIATFIHLSPYHFQRLFTQWAGISPKRFLQYLTLEYAKIQIQQSKNLLDTSLASGLSSSSRLYDLFIHLEAISPNEFKTQGLGLDIYYGVHNTPFGEAFIAVTQRGICNLEFFEDKLSIDKEKKLASLWPKAQLIYDPSYTQKYIEQIFQYQTEDQIPSLSVLVKGTNFQIQVWRALLNIPFGAITSYSHIAHMIQNPKASRAVGTAIGKNPIAYLIPCHRVIRESGEIGEYLWGGERKLSMLAWEAGQGELNNT